jgi:hypothetical protein
MGQTPGLLPPKQTLLLILLPMLTTVACLRAFLHGLGVRHVYPGGYLVHHLFVGIAMVVPAAFVLAFPVRSRRIAILTRLALGVGSGLILDEVVFLVATKATDADYVSRASLLGAMGFVLLATLLLVVLCWYHRD